MLAGWICYFQTISNLKIAPVIHYIEYSENWKIRREYRKNDSNLNLYPGTRVESWFPALKRSPPMTNGFSASGEEDVIRVPHRPDTAGTWMKNYRSREQAAFPALSFWYPCSEKSPENPLINCTWKSVRSWTEEGNQSGHFHYKFF